MTDSTDEVAEVPDGADDSVEATADAGTGADEAPVPGSMEELLTSTLDDLEQRTAERDEYLDLARRVQADFENYKRRVESQRVEQVQRAAESLVIEILPVLDACEAALGHGAEDVAPIHSALVTTLEKRGLSRVDAVDVPFDPEVHEAVMTEEGDGDGPTVAAVMRTGYSWNGRVVRPAMVKVRG